MSGQKVMIYTWNIPADGDLALETREKRLIIVFPHEFTSTCSTMPDSILNGFRAKVSIAVYETLLELSRREQKEQGS